MSEHENPDILEETSDDYLVSMWYSGSTIYGVHLGWFALAATLIIAYFWPQIQSKLDRNYKERQEKAYEAKCKKNPDWVQSRQQAMEAARLRMQEELSRKAKEHSEKMKEREEQKRQERLDSLDKEAGGHTLGGSDSNATTNNNKKGKNSFKPEYHPLMGSGPSTTYRPPRRSCCPSSGGCG